MKTPVDSQNVKLPEGLSFNLMYDVALGLLFGYPLCCIFNFVRLIRAGFKPAKYMWIMYDNADMRNDGYVKCHSCQTNPIPVTRRRWEYLALAKRYVSSETLLKEIKDYDSLILNQPKKENTGCRMSISI